MKAIILAAGQGVRLGEYTRDLPKAMLPFLGRGLIERQIDTYRRCGVETMVVIGGYRSERLELPGILKYTNKNYARTNMVESLLCARAELEGEILVSYADVLFEDRVLRAVMEAKADIGVAVDTKWERYWMARFGSTSVDTESLLIGSDGRLLEVGRPDPPAEGIHGRYVGLMRFSAQGTKTLLAVYDRARQRHRNGPWQTAKSFETGYMTDLLQEIIDAGHTVYSIGIEGGWLEFDTTEDYENAVRWAKTGELERFCLLADRTTEDIRE
jgi:L-glutamine-phosphate cytidylyltransferase